MCGIVGMVSHKSMGFDQTETTIFDQLLFANMLRGDDSTGAFLVDRDANIQYLKSKDNAPNFQKTSDYIEFSRDLYQTGRMVVGHNRKATRGTVTDENAHPFTEQNTILVHNGTIFNQATLATEKVDVDSHAILHGIVEHGYEKTLNDINGAYALAWYDADAKNLYLARNKERPLFVANCPGAWYFASEKEMLAWVLARNRVTPKDWTDLSPGYVYRFEFEKRDWMKTKPLPSVRKEVQNNTASSGNTFPVAKPNLLDATRERPRIIQERKEKVSQSNSTPSSEGKETKTSTTSTDSKGGGKVKYTDPNSFLVGHRYTIDVLSVFRNNNDTEQIGYILGQLHFQDHVPVRVWFTKKEQTLFDYLLEHQSDIITATLAVTHVTKEGKIRSLHCNKPETLVSKNDLIGREVFPEDWVFYSMKCRVCGTQIKWSEVENSDIHIWRGIMIATCVCEKCTGAT